MHGGDDNKSTSAVVEAYLDGTWKTLPAEVLSTAVHHFADPNRGDWLIAADIYEFLGEHELSRQMLYKLDDQRKAKQIAS